MSYENQIDDKVNTLIYASTFIVPNGGGDVTGFSLPIMANTSYEFEFEVIYQTAGTSRRIGLGVNGPAGGTVVVYSEIPTSLAVVQTNMARAYATATAASAVDSINADVYCKVYGTVVNGVNAGNLILWANKNTTGGTVTVRPNSVMKLWEIK